MNRAPTHWRAFFGNDEPDFALIGAVILFALRDARRAPTNRHRAAAPQPLPARPAAGWYWTQSQAY